MNLTICGLVFDVVGVAILAGAFLRPLEANKITRFVLDGTDDDAYFKLETLSEHVKRNMDGKVGTVCLLAGFVLQALGQFDSLNFRAGEWPLALLSLLVLFVCPYYSKWRDALVQPGVKRVKRELLELEESAH